MGIVYAPALGRLFHTGDGQTPVESAGGRIRALAVRSVPSEGLTAVASRTHRDPATDGWLATHRISKTTAIGSSLKFCLVAAGEADVYPRFGPTMEWDTAAGEAVLRAARWFWRRRRDEFTYGKPAYRNGAFIACGALFPAESRLTNPPESPAR